MNKSKSKDIIFKTDHKVPEDALNRIWEVNKYKVFISHLASDKKEAETLKNQLRIFGVSGFVAHKDIKPSLKWLNEIEFALSSMDAMVVIMTENFHESKWTDQEIGFAMGRLIPIIVIRSGSDPYGFVGQFQAVPGPIGKAYTEILKILINEPKMQDSYIQAMQECPSYDKGNILATILPDIETLTIQKAKKMIRAFNKNDGVRASWGFSGQEPAKYGKGLIPHLKRLTNKEYRMENYKIRVEKRG